MYRKTIYDLAEIVAVCDIFDALSSRRSYKKAFKKHEVKKIIKEQFNGNPSLIEDS